MTDDNCRKNLRLSSPNEEQKWHLLRNVSIQLNSKSIWPVEHFTQHCEIRLVFAICGIVRRRGNIAWHYIESSCCSRDFGCDVQPHGYMHRNWHFIRRERDEEILLDVYCIEYRMRKNESCNTHYPSHPTSFHLKFLRWCSHSIKICQNLNRFKLTYHQINLCFLRKVV